MDYSIYVRQCAGDVRLHTFLGSENVLANASHIIEGKSGLVVVDGQIDIPTTKEFLKYINGLGKPVLRVYVTHAHVDHFVTLSLGFKPENVYALKETIDVIAEHGDEMRLGLKAFYGDNIPASVLIPGNIALPGNEVIDGIDFVFEHVVNAEAEHQLVIKLPQFNAVIAGDLVYSGTYIYFDSLELDNWLAFLESIKGYEIILAGHGKPADRNEAQANIDYLKAAAEATRKHYPYADAFKTAMIAAYPGRTVPILIDIHTPRLFANMSK